MEAITRPAGFGKAVRAQVPRRSHGAWSPAPGRPDPVAVLERQAATRVPALVPVRYGRMLLALLARGLERLALVDLGRLARAGDDLLGLHAGLLEALAVLGQQLLGLRLGALRRIDRVLDGLLALVERVADGRERELPQHEQGDAERQQRPDHDPDVRRDEEVAAVPALLSGEDDVGREAHGYADRKKAIRPKMNA
jgi:hypothetical protein